MSDETVEMNIDGLHKFLSALKAKPPMARVGILGGHDARDTGTGGTSNATIGAAHEFGTSKLPMRSFLRIPLSYHLSKVLEQSGAFTDDALKHVVAGKTLVPWLEKVGIEAVGIVLDAFDTAGGGSWAPLNPDTMKRKRVKQILVETQQLRNSITYEVTE